MARMLEALEGKEEKQRMKELRQIQVPYRYNSGVVDGLGDNGKRIQE
jgi:hypothetical protein